MDDFKECCKTCRNRLEIKKYDYSNGGCVHSDPGGYICLAFSDEGLGVWMYGLIVGMCESYSPKEEKDMSLDKAIEHGKEKRKPYRGSKAVDPTCRNHGGCKWCKENRTFSDKKREPVEEDWTREEE